MSNHPTSETHAMLYVSHISIHPGETSVLSCSTHVGNTEILRLLKLGIEIAHILFLSNNFEVTSFTRTSLPSGLARMKPRGSLFKLRKGFGAKAELPAVRAPRTRAGPDCVGFSPPHLLSGESWTPAPFLKESATFFSQ